MGKWTNNSEDKREELMYGPSVDVLLYLAGCVVNDIKPDAERIANMDLKEIYNVAKQHSLTAVIGYALELAGVNDTAFVQARLKAIRCTALMDADMAAVLGQMEKAGIWYMPLKGAILKDLYPAYGIRQMGDRDILFDAGHAEDVRNIMEGLGFKTKHYGSSHHDCYFKPPVSNFEMHLNLFGKESAIDLYQYYADVKSRLLKDKDNKYGWHFKAEDFYIYMILHEYNHFSSRGTGLRSVLDTYIYLKNTELDADYIANETEKLGITEFEQANRLLALHLFNGEVLSEYEKRMLHYFATSGVYGNEKYRAENALARLGRCECQ